MSPAGYSGTPLPKKLGIKEAHTVAFLDAPESFGEALGPLDESVTVRNSLRGTAPLDVVVLFVRSRGAFEKKYPRAQARIAKNGGLWIAWPKKSSGVKTDMSEGIVREVALPTGLVDNKVCAIDSTWSGLRLVWRKELR